MWTPLIVKAPGQTEPRVDDANVESIDVLPTLAAAIGVDLPWPVDGADADSDEVAGRDDEKSFHRFESTADPGPAGELTVDGAAGFAAVLDLAFPPVVAGADPILGLYAQADRGDLVGQPFLPTGAVDGDTFDVDDRDRLLRSDDRVLVLTGLVDDAGRGDHVVAALDGEIIGVSPVIQRNIGGRAFALLLPTDRDVDLAAVHLALVEGADILDAGTVG
jgi:hypothetical protein